MKLVVFGETLWFAYGFEFLAPENIDVPTNHRRKILVLALQKEDKPRHRRKHKPKWRTQSDKLANKSFCCYERHFDLIIKRVLKRGHSNDSRALIEYDRLLFFAILMILGIVNWK